MGDEPIYCACGCGEEVRRRRFPSQQNRYINTHQHRGEHNGNYRGGKGPRACPVCGKTFYDWPSQTGVTCGSDDCYRKWQGLTARARGQRKVSVACDYCGAELHRFPSQVKGYNFCNRFCQGKHHSSLFSGPNDGNWRGGKRSYHMRQARIRDGYRCVICGFGYATEVHHIIALSKGGEDDVCNLITLCPNHHRMVHNGIIELSDYQRFDWKPENTAQDDDSIAISASGPADCEEPSQEAELACGRPQMAEDDTCYGDCR